jgi:hypothetical protein
VVAVGHLLLVLLLVAQLLEMVEMEPHLLFLEHP